MGVQATVPYGMQGILSELLEEFQQEMLEQQQVGTDPASQLSGMPSAALLQQTSADTLSISQKAAALSASDNMMAKNFAGSSTPAPSRYLASVLDSFAINEEMQMSLQETMSQFMAEMGGEAVAGEARPAYFQSMVARRLRDKRASESFERNLEESKEKLDEQAAEAVAPKDENGNPIPVDEHGTPEILPSETMPPDAGIAPPPANGAEAGSSSGAAEAAQDESIYGAGALPSLPASDSPSSGNAHLSIDITV